MEKICGVRSFLFILFAALLLHGSAALGQRESRALREILELQDSRSTGDGKLVGFLAHRDPQIRFRALIALANLQDTATLAAIVPLLNDKSSRVRQGAAFAIGQIGAAPVESRLAERLTVEKDPGVLQRILEALGKSGDERSLDLLLSYRAPARAPAVTAEKALSFARLALRGIKQPRGFRWCFERLGEKDPGVRWKALYALWRMCPSTTADDLAERNSGTLRELTRDKSSDVRIQLAILLGRIRSAAAGKLLRDFADREFRSGSWRVQVELVKSLIAQADRNPVFLEKVLLAFSARNDNVRVAACSGIAGMVPSRFAASPAAVKLKDQIRKLVESKSKSEMSRGEALVAYARIAPHEFRYESWLRRKDLSDRFKSKILEAMSLIASPAHLQTMVELLNDQSVRISTAAWEFIPRLLQPLSLDAIQDSGGSVENIPDQLYRQAKKALLREDIAVTTLVAGALKDSSVNALLQTNDRAGQIVEDLMLAYTQLSSPGDVEAMQAVLQTLGDIGDERCVPVLERALGDPDRTVGLEAVTALRKITGNDYSDSLQVTRHTPGRHDWETFDRLKDTPRATIMTSRGQITIRLLKNDAPFTVLNFVKLARKKFYDGLTFHRVVPNFVIQGGDPRGDGWGGPGYANRTEVSTVNYQRGSIGMASAGKDTEGSQFFITHSPEPHLDGRYSIFAEVVKGMDIVDAIEVGDKILTVRISN